MKTQHFVNLTNGIEAIESLKLKDYKFLRIQSSHCESKRFDKVLQSLSDDFLMNLALGHICIVHDKSSHGNVPTRAQWQGLEFVKFFLWKEWYNTDYRIQGRAEGAENYFTKYLKTTILPWKDLMKKFKYYHRFLDHQRGMLTLKYQFGPTARDGDYDWYVSHIKTLTLGD